LSGYLAENVTIRGFSGVLTYPDPSVDPYGGVHVAWIDPHGLHVVFTTRGHTASGTSGLSNADLLRVARSLYG
jgi:hypothetical protein